MKTKYLFTVCFLILHSAFCLSLRAQSTAFTYQGRLEDGGSPASGSYDLRFALFNAVTAGTQQGGLLTNTPTPVSNGLFTVTLDFGNQFPGADRWLEIAVRTNGGGVFSTLSPRQPLTATPYAIHAASSATAGTADGVAGSVAASQLVGTIASSNIGPGTIFSTQLAPGVAAQNLAQGGYTVPQGENIAFSLTPGYAPLLTAGYTNNAGWLELNAAETWTQRSTNGAPVARQEHTAVWTGTELIVWGGVNNSGNHLNSGARYHPSNDTWTAISTVGAPLGRRWHSAIWTGTEMIIWGGSTNGVNPLADGARYTPANNSWTNLPVANRPPAAYQQTAVWTGTEMIVFGGYSDAATELDSGGRYHPASNTWTQITGPTRADHAAVWTGSRMILWGGVDEDGFLQTGLSIYNPTNNSWASSGASSPPVGRKRHSAIWTGTEMIVWGGFDTINRLNTGGRYNFAADTWSPTATSGAPAIRDYHTAVWSGIEMIVWGGENPAAQNTGGRYNPVLNTWSATSLVGAPRARYYHVAVNAGSHMLLFGGTTGGLTLGDFWTYSFPKRLLHVYEKP